jgi:hypothetical protein
MQIAFFFNWQNRQIFAPKNSDFVEIAVSPHKQKCGEEIRRT